MENVSELTLLEMAGLPSNASTLLVDPPNDGLVASLASERPICPSVFTWDAASAASARISVGSERVYAWVQEHDWHRDDGLANHTFDCVVLFMPKAKEKLDLTLVLLAPVLLRACSVMLVGVKRSGVESAAKRLRQDGWGCRKTRSARHSQCWQISPPASFAADPECFWKSFELLVNVHQSLRISSLPGVFSHGELDEGSRLLVQALTGLLMSDAEPKTGGEVDKVMVNKPLRASNVKLQYSDSARILDFGCGAGVIALWLLAMRQHWRVDALDIDQLALLCTARNATVNKLSRDRLTLIHADGIGQLAQRYAMIVTNPPFHQGQRQDLSATIQFLLSCRQHLWPDGSLVMVANRFLPYPDILDAHFKAWQVVSENSKFRVYHACI